MPSSRRVAGEVMTVSYTIYNGYRVLSSDPFDVVRRCREQLWPLYCRLHAQEVVRRAVLTVDLAHVEGRDLPKSALSAARKEWRDECRATAREASGEHTNDYAFTVTIGQDPNDGALYAIVFTASQDMQAGWDQLDVQEFGYWNNSDRPEHLNDHQWRQRRQVWDRVLPDGVPAHHMLSFRLDELPFPSSGAPEGVDARSWLDSLIPGPGERARQVARTQLWKQADEQFSKSKKDFDFSVLRMMGDWVAERLDERSAQAHSILMTTDQMQQVYR